MALKLPPALDTIKGKDTKSDAPESARLDTTDRLQKALRDLKAAESLLAKKRAAKAAAQRKWRAGKKGHLK